MSARATAPEGSLQAVPRGSGNFDNSGAATIPVPLRNRSLRITAIHEAGHAVISCALGVKVRSVTIVPTKDYRGLCLHAPVRFAREGVFDDSQRGIERARRHILTLFAGQLAQRRFAPRSRWRIAGEQDRAGAMELFWRICSHDEKARNLELALLWRQAELLVDQHWQRIEAVADALLKRKRLSGDEVIVTERAS